MRIAVSGPGSSSPNRLHDLPSFIYMVAILYRGRPGHKRGEQFVHGPQGDSDVQQPDGVSDDYVRHGVHHLGRHDFGARTFLSADQ